MTAADISSNGLRPARSTKRVLTPLLTNWTTPIMMVAVIASNVLPEMEKIIYWLLIQVRKLMDLVKSIIKSR